MKKIYIYQILKFIKQECFLYSFFMIKNMIIRAKSPKVNVRSIEETIEKVIEDHCSVSRFGDGEFFWMVGIKQDSFQDYSIEMSRRLKEILVSSIDNHIVCLPDAFGGLRQYNRFAKRFWMEFMCCHRMRWVKLIDINKTYYNTNMTRLYMDFANKKKCIKRFELIKGIWNERNILIIEGEKTRLGVGNDLFDNTLSIKRILAPAKNAYSKYNEILDKAISSAKKDDLILIALGPTATIIAFDLTLKGYQAIDVGHVDIEYEWLKMNAREKIPILNKYVNEAPHQSGTKIGEICDQKYYEQIIDKVLY